MRSEETEVVIESDNVGRIGGVALKMVLDEYGLL